MADSPYETLGVAPDATAAQIRSAYLKLAKTSHPDLNPGDPKAEARFKTVNAAHDLLSNVERRARFDRGEIDASGNERPPPQQRSYRAHAEGAAGGRYRAPFDAEDDFGDILSDLLRARASRPGGLDRRYTLVVPFLDALRGTTQRLTLPDGKTLDVRIPAGIETGHTLRLRGEGEPGSPAGDALIEIDIAPHPIFQQVGRDIHIDLPVSVAEVALGGRVTVPTVTGSVSMTIPPGSDSGTKLRLRGKGMPATATLPAGDGYATLRIVLGPADPGLAAFLRDRTDKPDWNPRAGLEADT